MIGQEKLQKFKAEFGSRNCSKGGVHSNPRIANSWKGSRLVIADVPIQRLLT